MKPLDPTAFFFKAEAISPEEFKAIRQRELENLALYRRALYRDKIIAWSAMTDEERAEFKRKYEQDLADGLKELTDTTVSPFSPQLQKPNPTARSGQTPMEEVPLTWEEFKLRNGLK